MIRDESVLTLKFLLRCIITEIAMASAIGKLLSCDYPFLWNVRSELATVPGDMIERLTDQLNEKVFEEESYFEQYV